MCTCGINLDDRPGAGVIKPKTAFGICQFKCNCCFYSTYYYIYIVVHCIVGEAVPVYDQFHPQQMALVPVCLYILVWPLTKSIADGFKTLRTQDTLDPRHFGTTRLVLKCPDRLAPVLNCIVDTSALVPNCHDFQETFCYSRPYRRKV